MPGQRGQRRSDRVEDTARQRQEARPRHVFPDQVGFVRHATANGSHAVLHPAIAVAERDGARTPQVLSGQLIVTRQRPIPVLESVERRLDPVLLGNEVAHAGARDQFLALENAAQQQSDDDQHDGDFDQRESALSMCSFHGENSRWKVR